MGYKNILHIWFSHFTLTETHWCKNYFMLLYFNKKGSPCWPRQSKPSLKLLDCSRKIQNDVYIDTLLQTRAHIMTINQHDSVSYTFSVPNWLEMCGVVNVLTVFSCDQAALQMVFSVCLSVRLSVCHTFLTMFPSSHHHEIFRSYYQWPEVKVRGQGHRGHNPT